jgi:hypothetical protein
MYKAYDYAVLQWPCAARYVCMLQRVWFSSGGAWVLVSEEVLLGSCMELFVSIPHQPGVPVAHGVQLLRHWQL